jgi:MFS family permease
MSDVWSRTKRILRGNLGVLILTTGLWNIAGSLADPYFALYVLALGGSYFEVGLTSAVGNLFMLMPLVFAGSLADVIGRKRLVVFLGFLLSSIYIIFSQAPSWEFLLLGTALNALIHGFREPAFASLVADSTPPEDRALAIALWQRIPQAISLASPVVGGVVIDRLGVVTAMRGFYVITCFTCIASHILRYKYLKETLTASKTDILEGVKATLTEIKEIASHVPRQALILIGINAALHLALMTSDSYWVIYATDDVVGLTASQWGLVTLVQNIILIVCTILFSVVADRYGNFRFVLASLLLTPVTIALFPFSQGFTHVLFLRSAYSLSTSLRTATFSAMFIDNSPREFRGRLNALQRFASRPMVVSGSLLGGYLYQTLSKPAPFFFNALVMSATGLAFFILMKGGRRKAGPDRGR